MHSLEPVHLAAGAEEDRAALSGRPRKADAGQYAIVLHQSHYEIVLQHRTPPARVTAMPARRAPRPSDPRAHRRAQEHVQSCPVPPAWNAQAVRALQSRRALLP